MNAVTLEALRGWQEIAALRVRQGVTQGTVARCAGVSNATICLLEAGGRARPKTIAKAERGYAKALGQVFPRWPLEDKDETETGSWIEAQLRAFLRERFPAGFTGPRFPLTIEDLRTLVRGTIYVWRSGTNDGRPRPRKERDPDAAEPHLEEI